VMPDLMIWKQILVIYWKKTGLLHILLQESKPFTSSDARSHDL
jgi:hypothetical protein